MEKVDLRTPKKSGDTSRRSDCGSTNSKTLRRTRSVESTQRLLGSESHRMRNRHGKKEAEDRFEREIELQTT